MSGGVSVRKSFYGLLWKLCVWSLLPWRCILYIHWKIQCVSVYFILLVEDLIAGRRVYMTASTAREHTNKLWEREGKPNQYDENLTHFFAVKRSSFQNEWYFLPAIILKCLFSGLEAGTVSKQGEKGFYPDLFFLELLVVPPCRYSVDQHTHIKPLVV